MKYSIAKLNKQLTGKTTEVWWEPGTATILEVRQYTGKYPHLVACILKLTANRTHKGWLETTIQHIDLKSLLKQHKIKQTPAPYAQQPKNQQKTHHQDKAKQTPATPEAHQPKATPQPHHAKQTNHQASKKEKTT